MLISRRENSRDRIPTGWVGGGREGEEKIFKFTIVKMDCPTFV